MNINLTSVVKVTITVSIVEMWKNAVGTLGDFALNGSGTNALELFKEVGLALLGDDGPNRHLISKLFNDGNTFILLNDEAMKAIDSPNILREIVIVDKEENILFTIYHEDINF